MTKLPHHITGLCLAAMLCSCSGGAGSGSTAQKTETPKAEILGAFSADSAYAEIQRQLAFGPRVPGSPGHRACAEYLQNTLKRHGADTVITHSSTVTRHDGQEMPIKNIMARYNKAADKRILLLAHYDTRPWADRDPNPEMRSQPIPGANDGASGVAVLLEIARNLGQKAPTVGVDILMVDAEDSGSSDDSADTSGTWCLGTQKWLSEGPYSTPGAAKPAYGILLDMVGGQNARFHREYFSQNGAKSITDKIWREAAAIGHGNTFINSLSPGGVVDDHIWFIKKGIPVCDIVESDNISTGSFPPYWHTMADDIQIISKQALNATGQTVLNVIYKETR